MDTEQIAGQQFTAGEIFCLFPADVANKTRLFRMQMAKRGLFRKKRRRKTKGFQFQFQRKKKISCCLTGFISSGSDGKKKARQALIAAANQV